MQAHTLIRKPIEDTMPPPPAVAPQLVRQAFFDLAERLGRPATAAEVAKELERTTGKKIRPSTVRGMVHRYGWDDLPKAARGGRAPMTYRVEQVLGPIRPEHYRQHYWFLATAYERAQAGFADEKGVNAQASQRLVDDLTHFGDVLDYSETKGFFVRPGWPWEAGDYLAQRERPEDWPERLREALRAPQGHQATEENLRVWAAELAATAEELG